ncbi:MAG: CBS domain-containing protein [Thermodesulfobacteriota bacterium]
MKQIMVKDLMVPLSEYATIGEGATLYEAVLALEKAQADYSRRLCPHRALVVLNDEGRVVGRLSQWDVFRALEPKYLAMGDQSSLSRAGFSPQFLRDLMEQFALWDKPLADICNRAAGTKVKDFMYTPSAGEYIEAAATLDQALHIFVMGHHHSLLVTSAGRIVGILMLPDVFKVVCERMKACEV